jgi:pilus assembly protein CpaC
MYMNFTRRSGYSRLSAIGLAIAALTTLAADAWAQMAPPSVVRNISKATERLEMTVNTSQILTLGTRIPKLVVNNPELLTATPISDTQIQIAARKPGVTQINLWDEQGNIYTVDLLIFGDVRELELALKQMYPTASIKVVRLTNSLVLNGQVDRPEIVQPIFQLAQDYAPKVVSNLTVGGAQQVMLKVKVMEVSRTKLRKLGSDFAIFGNDFSFVSNASDLISTSASAAGLTAQSTGQQTIGVVSTGNFFMVLDFLQQNQVSKILADPTLVTLSGRPASFLVGGQLPILVPSGLGQTTIEYKDFGTQVDFVPIVLGNGRIRLEVRPRLSEIDDSRSVTVNGFTVPALKVRQVDTGVEMTAGQTLALAGLIQERIEGQTRGIPYVMDLPVLGVPFRKVEEEVNTIDNLILVTPEFADAMDPHEVPPCGPGMETMSPSNGQLYWKGHIEVPACGQCGAYQPCQCTAPGLRCENGQYGPAGAGVPYGPTPTGPAAMATDSMPLYGGSGMEGGAPIPTPAEPVTPMMQQPLPGPQMGPVTPEGDVPPNPGANWAAPSWNRSASAPLPQTIRPVSAVQQVSGRPTSTPGLIGSIGYDVQK